MLITNNPKLVERSVEEWPVVNVSCFSPTFFRWFSLWCGHYLSPENERGMKTQEANVGWICSENNKEPSLVLQRVVGMKAVLWSGKGLLRGFVQKVIWGHVHRGQGESNKEECVCKLATTTGDLRSILRNLRSLMKYPSASKPLSPKLDKSGVRGIDSPALLVYACMSAV